MPRGRKKKKKCVQRKHLTESNRDKSRGPGMHLEAQFGERWAERELKEAEEKNREAGRTLTKKSRRL